MEELENTDDTLEIAVSGVAKKLHERGRFMVWFGKIQTTFFSHTLVFFKNTYEFTGQSKRIWSHWGLLKCPNY